MLGPNRKSFCEEPLSGVLPMAGQNFIRIPNSMLFLLQSHFHDPDFGFLLPDALCSWIYFLYKIFQYGTLFTYIIICVDRYLFTSSTYPRRRPVFAVAIIVISWILSILTASPMLAFYRVKAFDSLPTLRICYVKDEKSPLRVADLWTEMVVYTAVLLLCGGLYACMYLRIAAENKRLVNRATFEWAHSTISGYIAQVEVRKHAVKVSCYAMVIFAICTSAPIFNNLATM
ncbi:7 transmembrane receptor (rhodopsin family) domain-containing protein [Ditylenchus destructor]|nr:7 transmembrane receptor (rhodopsin family) domain-containing protein [Ditylenchus destructor]